VATAAAGVASTTANLASRQFAVFVNTSGVDDATSAGVHSGAVDENGAEILPLEQTPMLPGQWSAIGELDADSFTAYRAGNLYAQVATPAQADGEIRGQIVPPDAMEEDSEAPTVTLSSPGGTVDGTVTLEADASDDIGVVEVSFLVDGVLIGSDDSAPYSTDWDTTTVTDGDKTLTAEAEDAAGNVGTSAGVDVTVQNAAMVTLTQIQNEVFTPVCSACHTGPTGNILPTGMNLSSTADSFAALVGVASIQVPALDRVEAGNPDDSYLIQKLEGTQTVGERMPQGGPFLDQETIDTVRQWITDGAPNN
jgi:mono/diheme cytochrome c family protein